MAHHPLPPCKFRGVQTRPGYHACTSPLLVLPTGDVPDHRCTICHVRNRSPEGPAAAAIPEAGRVRHLAYHVYPAGEEWRPNLAAVRKRISLFNGQRVFAVATGDGAAPLAEVHEELAGLDAEVLPLPNSTMYREMATYPALMRRMASFRGGADCHWYGHAKGVSSAVKYPRVREWRECMYAAQLDHWPAMRGLLESYAAVGQFLRPDHIIPGSSCKWHFSGTFSWRRALPLFDREWDSYDQHWCGSESHLGRLLRRTEVHSLYGEHCAAGLGLYLPSVWDGGMRRQHEEWCDAHAAEWRQPMLATVILTAARQKELVHEAIASVLAQTTDEWQLLVVDAGELHAEGTYLRYLRDGRVSVMTTGETEFERSKLCIQGWAINQAFRRGRVRGDVVVCLCDDDQLDAGWLAAVLAAARSEPKQAAWYGPAQRWARSEGGQEECVGFLPTVGTAGRGNQLRGKVDGMQLAVRKAAWRPWPEERSASREADGFWMDAIADRTAVHPLDALAGRHRHTPLSTFTTNAGPVGV